MIDKRDISRKDFFNILMSGAGLLAAEKIGLFNVLESGSLDIATESLRSIVRNSEIQPS